VLSIKTCLEGGNLVKLNHACTMIHHGMPLQHLLSNHMQSTSMGGGAAKALFCRNIMEACKAREYGSESKRKHQVEGVIMQAKEWTRTFGRCTRSRSNKASMSTLEKNRARKEVSLPSIFFVCSNL
jgi:hypothetical protein